MGQPAGRGAAGSGRPLLVVLVALVGVSAAPVIVRYWFPVGPILAFSTTAVLAAMVGRRFRWVPVAVGWLAISACVAVAWKELAPPASRYVAVLLAVPAAGSVAVVSRYVRGAPELLAVERIPKYWRRAAIASGIAACLGLAVWGSVLLGLRAERMDRVDESVDRVNAGLAVIAKELAHDAASGTEPDEQGWRDTLVHGALTTGRSLVLLGRPVDGRRRLVAAALWSREPRIHISYVDRASEAPPDLLSAAAVFAQHPEDYQRADVAWRFGPGDLPVGRPVALGEPAEGGPGGSEFNVDSTWTGEDSYVLLSLSAQGAQWWNEQGQKDYLWSAVLFFLWIHVLLVALSTVMMTALDSRSGLLASLHAEQQRAALRRDAHDRVYNRLAAIAHSLETGEGDRAMGRNASFEIRSAVSYLQRILEGEETTPRASSGPDAEALERQLKDICQSAERLWGMEVSLQVESDSPIDQGSSWDVQCVVDEALSNAGEHGRAGRAQVEIRVANGRVRISVQDDGKWLGHKGSGSTGLTGIRERLIERRGFISVDTDIAGTTVTAEFSV